ncbi:hypothetical protein CDAR_425331 [Caerostris darwini]|uniref:Uncharacterized protein n=1 Tax=Caerostris darwini TaxID=1538125 RepID=A0AAV4UAR5_9ARAC|nr:hypothetical protein CDAR_425331 [Caerostris darwini]
MLHEINTLPGVVVLTTEVNTLWNRAVYILKGRDDNAHCDRLHPRLHSPSLRGVKCVLNCAVFCLQEYSPQKYTPPQSFSVGAGLVQSFVSIPPSLHFCWISLGGGLQDSCLRSEW